MTVTENASPDHAGSQGRQGRLVTITINSAAVSLPQGRYSGLLLKQAAIAQGVHLALDFVLSVQRGDHYEMVGDADTLQIHPHMDFVAVTGDDNS